MHVTPPKDLPEYGLHLVPFQDSRFPALLNQILQQPSPFPAPSAGELESAAILLNESGKAIVVLELVWRHQRADGHFSTSRLANLTSSTQLDILCGRLQPEEELHTSILPGSKRLVMERGMLGTNADVLPSGGHVRMGGGVGFSGSGRGGGEDLPESTELVLDFAVLGDGLCVGPDSAQMFESLQESLAAQRAIAAEAGRALRNGSSEGAVFDLLLPLARESRFGAGRRHGPNLLSMFSRIGIDRLIHGSREEQVAWFESFAAEPAFRLHR